jgi:hypothetical protein
VQHIFEALIKDIAEQLRPMVADMVRQELANADGDDAMAGIAQNIDLSKLAEHLSMGEIAAELTDSQLTIIAGDVDLADLAGEFDADKLADKLDIDSAIRTFFENNPATLSF